MSESNPYATPEAAVRNLPAQTFDVPEDITSPIKHGWIAALVSGTLTLLITAAALARDLPNAGTHAWNFLDVVLIFGLAFGIYRKSRTAATVMFFYFLLSKILIMVESGMPTGVVFGIVFLIFYFRAMAATYRYHRFIRQAKLFPPVPKQRLSDDPYFQKPSAAP